MTSFRVGQKVVCVNDDGLDFRHGEKVPAAGVVYTIRSICTRDPGLSFRLVEIVNEPRQYRLGHGECSFMAYRFRPVVERKTDISIFRAMLNPSKQKEPAA